MICVYIFEETDALRAKGGASLWWLDKSLRALRSDISSLGGKLVCRKGDPEKIVPALVEETKATSVFWGRRYGKAEREIDGRIKQALQDNGIDARSFNTTLLTEPWQIETGSGGYYKVFTPYWKAVRESYEAPSTLPRPEKLGGMGVNGEDPKLPDRVNGGYIPLDPSVTISHDQIFGPGDSWTKMAFYVKMNSKPDATDGIFRQWINDEQIFNVTTIPWIRSSSSEDENAKWNLVAIGGNDFFQTYDNSERHEEWYSIDDVVIRNDIPESLKNGGVELAPPAPPAAVEVQ